MKNIINIFFAGVLIIGSLFLYGAFKNLDSLNDTEELPINLEEVVEGDSYERVFIEEWEDYKNEEYNFSIQYPEDWEVQEALKPQNPKALHEIDLHQKEYEMTRAYLTIQIFDNPEEEDVVEWWNEWLAEEDKKEADCQVEYKGEAPCLFLRGMVENETNSTLYNLPMKNIQLFQFDSSKECNYISYGKYIYGICYDGVNPNDPNFEANRKTTSEMFSTFIFNDLIKEDIFDEEIISNEKDFEKYIVGSWKSTTDSKSLMVLKDSGVTENIYDGKKIDSGIWTIDGYKLITTIEGEEYEYTVVFAGSERLELTFLPRGNTLHFIRK